MNAIWMEAYGTKKYQRCASFARKNGASEEKNQVAAGESNLSFALQKIPSQTVVSGAE